MKADYITAVRQMKTVAARRKWRAVWIARVKGSSEKTEKAVLPASPNQGGTVWSFASPLLTGTGLFILREEMF